MGVAKQNLTGPLDILRQLARWRNPETERAMQSTDTFSGMLSDPAGYQLT